MPMGELEPKTRIGFGVSGGGRELRGIGTLFRACPTAGTPHASVSV